VSSRLGFLTSAAAAFVTGAVAVLVFHQPTLALLHAAGLTQVSAYPMRPTNPFGAPVIVSLTGFGGAWSILIAWVLTRVPNDWRYWVVAALLGAFPPTLTSWFIIFPMKGLPFGGGAASVGMLNALVVNGVWGLGLGLLWRFVPDTFRFTHAAPGLRPPPQAEPVPGVSGLLPSLACERR
jgi:hypothetical protein